MIFSFRRPKGDKAAKTSLHLYCLLLFICGRDGHVRIFWVAGLKDASFFEDVAKPLGCLCVFRGGQNEQLDPCDPERYHGVQRASDYPRQLCLGHYIHHRMHHV